jgi:hypothetical protein
MKKFIIVLAVLFSVQAVYGQDIIITHFRDTVSCRILSISPEFIHYEQTENGETISQFIHREEVLEYYRSNYAYSKYRLKSKLTNHWRAGIQFGGSYLLASMSEMMNTGIPRKKVENYIKQLKHGVNAGGDIHYLPNKYIGVGAKYLFFHSSANLDFAGSSIRDDMYVNFVGLSVITEQRPGDDIKLSEGFAMGYSNLLDKTKARESSAVTNSELFIGHAHAIGVNIECSAEYYLSKLASVYANIGIFVVSRSMVTLSDQPSYIDAYRGVDVNLSRFDYSFGLRFHF